MKKMVMMMHVYGEGSTQRIMKKVAKFRGITTISMDARYGKLTVIGEEFNVSRIYIKLKRRWRNAELESFGPYNPTAATAESQHARFETYRENYSHYFPMQHHCYFPMQHHCDVGDHHHYHGCTIS